jgi:hypothetical protein
LGGEVGTRLMWLACCDDLDVGQAEPRGVVAADDGQARRRLVHYLEDAVEVEGLGW